MPAGPITLSSELSVACPELSAPAYPPLSRRLGEEGKLMLRVELDEKGYVSVARVVTSSGFKRLDDAAMAAVKTWRCTPPVREGQPVRAIALQPFNFVLQGD
jgi:protein TonB